MSRRAATSVRPAAGRLLTATSASASRRARMPSPVVPASPSMNTLGLLLAIVLFPNKKPAGRETGGDWSLPSRVRVQRGFVEPRGHPAVRFAHSTRAPPPKRRRRRSRRTRVSNIRGKLSNAVKAVNSRARLVAGKTRLGCRRTQVPPEYRCGGDDDKRHDAELHDGPAGAGEQRAGGEGRQRHGAEHQEIVERLHLPLLRAGIGAGQERGGADKEEIPDDPQRDIGHPE